MGQSGELTRGQALKVLGLPDDAESDEILEVYRSKSQPLKRSLVTASTIGKKNKYRAALRELVLARNAALGRAAPEPDQLTLRWEPLVARLEKLDPDALTRKERLAVLDLPPGASDTEVQHHFVVRYRVLTRGLGTAHTERALASLQNARAKMRAIRFQLLDASDLLDSVTVESPEAEGVDPGFEDSRSSPALLELSYDDDAAESEDLDLTLTEGFINASEERSAYDAAIEQIRGERSMEDSARIDLSGVQIEPEPTMVTNPERGDGPSDPRELLGLDRDAGADEITRAYRSRVRSLRTRMLLTEDEDQRKEQLDAIRQLRRHRDAALRDAGVDDIPDDNDDELDQLPG